MKPSAAAVLELLRERGSRGLTDGEAHDELQQSRLAARIKDLEAEGIRCRSELVSVDTEHGPVRVSRYWLASEPFRAGHPIGRVRQCPACRDMHAPGTTCAWPARDVPQGGGNPPTAALPSAAAGSRA